MQAANKRFSLGGTLSSPLRSIVGPATTARSYATLPTEAKVVRYEKLGHPAKVLTLKTEKLPAVGENEVLLRILAAPINPADINMIEGVYPIRPTIPAVPGNEGVGEILAVGNGVKGLSVNDWVIPAKPGFGTWRTHAVCSEKELLKVKKDIKPEYIANMTVNPCTAYRLLEDFVKLNPGDTIIQNAANSVVAQVVNQLAKARGIKTINILRERPDWDNTVERLKAYGAFVVFPDHMVGSADFRTVVSDLPAPRLGLNCVGGPIVTEMARYLDKDGVMVTYGGMSKKPIQIPTSQLIFKNLTFKGFWLSRWIEEHSVEERMKMMDELWQKVKDKDLRLWMERHPFETDFFSALKRATEVQRHRKVVLMMADYRESGNADD